MEDNELDQIVYETDPRDPLSKIGSPKIDYMSTEYYAPNQKFTTDKELTVFKPSISIKLLNIFFILFFWTCYIGVLINPKTEITSNIVLIGFIVIIGTLISIYYTFFKNDLKFTIYIDKEGIQFDRTLYDWSNIYLTIIAIYAYNKSRKESLILIFKDKTYVSYQLDNYTINQIKIITRCIEHYKPK